MKFVPVELLQAESTNDDAFLALKTAPTCLLWTLDQRNGRGSRGREWLSPPGSSLALSLGICDPELPSPNGFCYPLFAGLFVLENLALLGHAEGVRLKWPNDLFLNGRKLGGILCESRISNKHLQLVIGIGLNLKPNPHLGALPKGYASFAETGRPPDPHALVECLARHAPNALRLYRDQALMRARWLQQAWVPLGAALRLQFESEKLQGTFQGLGENGELILHTPNGPRHLQQLAVIEDP